MTAHPPDAVADHDAAASIDGGVSDAGRDGGHDAAAGSDAGRDAGQDAGHDAGHDGGRDAGSSDAGHDGAAPIDVGVDATIDAGPERRLECVALAGGGPTMSGMVFSPSFWVGFRFHITSATSLTSVGLSLAPDFGASGTVLAGIVALTDGFDGPDTPNLTGADVLATTLVTVPASSVSVVASAPLSASLPVGWYALVFGVGSGGATLSGATVYSQSGGGGCTLPESSYPFSIRQSDAMLILQGATPYFFVTVDP
jgi:hypothetical protein